ncbi:MAG: ester cyclase [Anaerolineae bacterium]|nr:ester cyclase [Anaerolineae bacterium]
MSAPSAERNKAIVRAYFEDVYNGGQDALIPTLFAPDFHEPARHTPLHGPQLAQHVVDYERSVLPDIHFNIEDLLAEGDDVVVKLRITGTHRGEYRGVAPSGNHVDIEAAQQMRLRDGQIMAIVWHVFDRWLLLHQMGAL